MRIIFNQIIYYLILVFLPIPYNTVHIINIKLVIYLMHLSTQFPKYIYKITMFFYITTIGDKHFFLQ